MGQGFWTDEKTQTAMKLWREGHSASEICKAIGASGRSAVLGKLNRLGLSGSTGGSRAVRSIAPRVRSEPKPKPPMAAKPPPPRPTTSARSVGAAEMRSEPPALEVFEIPKEGDRARIASTAFGEADRTPPCGGCKWLVGEGDQRPCNGPRADHRYCQAHRDLSSGKSPTAKLAKIALLLARKYG